jgi:soluble lytic murein transglycosylase-like protein
MKATDRYDSLIMYYAERAGVDWLLLKAQIRAESAFDPMARSIAGAAGLAQFMSATFEEWSQRLGIANANPYNPEHSIHCQAEYMRWLLDRFDGNVDRAIGAYNFGVGNELKHRPWPDETIQYHARIKQYLTEYHG